MDPDKIMEKTIEEGVKNSVGKMMDNAASFLGSICMPAAEEFGLYLKDRVAIYRLTNLHRVILKAQLKIKSHQKKQNHNVSPKLIKCIVDESSWSEDEKVQEMWAGLLAGAILNDKNKDDSVIYVNLLKELSTYEARLLDLIYSDHRIGSIRHKTTIPEDFFIPENRLDFHLISILNIFPTPLDYIVEGHSHKDILSDEVERKLALGFIRPQLDSLKRHGLIDGWVRAIGDPIVFEPNPTGLDLYMHCTGDIFYPLDAYLAVRRYWSELAGIDPLTWKPEVNFPH